MKMCALLAAAFLGCLVAPGMAQQQASRYTCTCTCSRGFSSVTNVITSTTSDANSACKTTCSKSGSTSSTSSTANKCEINDPKCDLPKEYCDMLVGYGVGVAALGTVVIILFAVCLSYPCLVFCCGYCIVVKPKQNQGMSTSGQQWAICMLVLFVVVYLIGIVGIGFTAGISSFAFCFGPCCMIIPFCQDSCYNGQNGNQQGLMAPTYMQAPMMVQQTMMAQPVMAQQPMMAQPVMASAPAAACIKCGKCHNQLGAQFCIGCGSPQ